MSQPNELPARSRSLDGRATVGTTSHCEGCRLVSLEQLEHHQRAAYRSRSSNMITSQIRDCAREAANYKLRHIGQQLRQISEQFQLRRAEASTVRGQQASCSVNLQLALNHSSSAHAGRRRRRASSTIAAADCLRMLALAVVATSFVGAGRISST